MKRIFLYISILLIISCEKVIDIDLTFSKEYYVIDAKVNKHVNSNDGFIEVVISKSRPYFENEIFAILFEIMIVNKNKIIIKRIFFIKFIFFYFLNTYKILHKSF